MVFGKFFKFLHAVAILLAVQVLFVLLPKFLFFTSLACFGGFAAAELSEKSHVCLLDEPEYTAAQKAGKRAYCASGEAVVSLRKQA
ncbi:MAG: hypothetical protein A3I61_11140 [Acidobacteria bacterium RIFCSPLOWO2_02_FULL_68_18]|nr:MAG: hypothetical protein A3I61_11140 [Acidobacteria bacterium RIFCSPLOWO2_02_FULL_68_18]OFW50625.1 MAG: hypothetical protein A3G77_16885 [Acidobacteria bacterium RIFCSPLOWO2_12_FULL_68_19]